jgi:amino acid adenylation domain-containing protein
MSDLPSIAQRAIWTGEQAGAGPAYRMPLAVWLDGDLDVPALLSACGDVIARHPILATTACETGDGLRLFAAAEPSVTVAAVSDPNALISDETGRGFDLEKGPLARFTLASAGSRRHLLLFVAHHLVFDGMSKDILLRDLARCYEARTGDGQRPAMTPLPFAEAAYAEHQRMMAALPAAREFWAERLPGSAEVTLPGQRRAAPHGPGEQIDAGIDDELGRYAAEVGRAAGATTFEVLLAATHALLFRYGNENVAVAIDVTTRRAQTRDHIGPLVSELPVLSSPAPGQTLHEFVRAIRGELRELYRFREVPLTEVLGGSQRAPSAPVSISYRRRDPAPAFSGLDLAVDWMMFGGGVRNALHIQFVDGPDGLAMALRFNPAAIGRDTAVQFGDGLRALLHSAADDPGIGLADLDVMSAARRRRVLTEWNDTTAGYPAQATLPGLFARQVRDRPDAIAVTSGDRSLSYADLDAAASRLARRLRRAGVVRGDLVAVHLRRSSTLLACLLAVHKAGAAYLPLDPDHPAERIAMIVADARPRLLMTAAAEGPGQFNTAAEGPGQFNAAAAPDGVQVPVLLADEEPADEEPVEEEPADEEPADDMPRPGDTAYVIYTSGSTGRPKGVEVEHGNLANLLFAMRDRLGTGPRGTPGQKGGTWLALTSPAFDISALELYLPLITGGRVVVAPHGAVRRPEALARLVAQERVTHVQATPSVWRLLLPGGITGVTALAGGEALPAGLARELRERCVRVINVYGPTETTIWSTCGEPGETVTIGRPIANTQIYLLDERMRPVPVGVAGELCIAGAGVARGYRDRAALTAERFVPDPYGPPGARLYRTGDQARYRADGEIEFLGRGDGQIKLLGHRIELGEIEARLLEHAGIRDAAVLVRDGDPGDARLIAYVVPEAGSAATPDPGALTAHLARTLPTAVLPSAFVTLDALPLTPVGKLDRRTLLAEKGAIPPAGAGQAVGEGDSGAVLDWPGPPAAALDWPGPPAAALDWPGPPAAANPDVVMVRRICHEVLELDDPAGIGVDDDLFDLGGHSLTITQMTARIREQSGVDVSLDAVFDDPTVGGIVAEIVRLRAAAAAPGQAAGQAAGDQTPLRPRPAGVNPPLSFGQERMWFVQRLHPDDASLTNYTVLRLRGRLDVAALQAAIDDLVARHESLRTSFHEENGEPVTAIHPPGPFPLEKLDLTGTADPEGRARQLVASRTNAPFDLAEAPPTRISLLALGRDNHVLCIVMHHIITDGWSDVVLMDDLYACYLARTAGRVPDLPAMPVQYGDIALWQRERYSGQAAEQALAYWRRRLADPQWLELPFADMPGVQGREGAYRTFEIPEEVTAALERLAQQHGASLFMVLVAAYQILLSRHSGQTDIMISTTWSARDRVELEPVIGYLTDPMVLRGDLSGDPAFADLLDGTRRIVLEAYAHRLVPFERLLNSLGVTREVHFRNPLLSTTLILHSQAGDGRPPGRLGDLSVEWFDDGYLQAQFTLGMQVWRTDDGMRVVLNYDVARFRAATIESLAARAAVLLRGIADAPGTPISRLPLLTDADVAALSTDQTPGQDRQETVPAAFARAAAAFPEATALVCGDEPGRGPSKISYAELDAMVARLAAELRRRGAAAGGPGKSSTAAADVIGVCLGRSADAVVALLAVWRAGAAYLPLDPEYPDSRLAFLIADSGARLVVTDAVLADRLPSGIGLVTVGVTAAAAGQSDAAGQHSQHSQQGGDQWPEPEPSDPAYLIYTSGSTGQAKGVLVEHGALAGRVHWMREEYGLRPGDRIVQFASLSFDTHAEELYPALTAGSSVLLLPDGAITLPDVLRGQSGRAVTVLDLPTAYWHQLTQALDDVAWPEALRLVIIGGEQAHAAAVARWRARFGDRVRLVNTYGPTEATIVATACELGAADTTGHPPIGRPVGGTIAYVLGPQGELMPPGAPGELYLGGEGLARGYLGRPALTARHFVPDPYHPGSRLYRTGDRVRQRKGGGEAGGGELEFLGRFDGQLKVRGYRVEPDEVMAALLRHPGVRQAAVTAAEDRLVAYVAGSAGPDELRRHLAVTLPPHLVPTVWVPLDTLPLTINGKVDLAGLPAPVPARATEFVPPRSEGEVLVARVWATVLGLDAGQVGALDDFFGLGGHSLLAVRVAALVSNAVDAELPLRTVFDHHTVADLAVAVEKLLIEQLSGVSDAEAARLLDEEAAR